MSFSVHFLAHDLHHGLKNLYRDDYKPLFLMDRKMLSNSFTFSGMDSARLFLSPISSFRLYSWGFVSLPSSISTCALYLLPLFGAIYFQSPWIMANALLLEFLTKVVRPCWDDPISACQVVSLSLAVSFGSCSPSISANEAIKSIWETIASEVPQVTLPGQLTIKGTRVPASKRL